MNTQEYTVGIIGGVGPLAGVYFQQLILDAKKVTNDQEHVPVICYTNPRIPDRNLALAGQGEDYRPLLIETAKTLDAAGASEIFLPCNTAHLAYDELCNAVSVPVYNLVKNTCDLVSAESKVRKVGLLATTATIKSGVFAQYLPEEFDLITPNDDDQSKVMDAIYAVKRAELKSAARLVDLQLGQMHDKGVEYVILGCTELSVVFDLLSSFPGLNICEPLRFAAQYIADKSERARVTFDT